MTAAVRLQGTFAALASVRTLLKVADLDLLDASLRHSEAVGCLFVSPIEVQVSARRMDATRDVLSAARSLLAALDDLEEMIAAEGEARARLGLLPPSPASGGAP